MRQYVTNSVEETEALGLRVGQKLRGPVVVAFFGGLGMGKTAFTRGIARGMDIDAAVSSPTFALVHEYHGNENTLYHFDMYRVESWDDLYAYQQSLAMNFYLRQCNSVEFGDERMKVLDPLIQDIIEKADAAIATGGVIVENAA